MGCMVESITSLGGYEEAGGGSLCSKKLNFASPVRQVGQMMGSNGAEKRAMATVSRDGERGGANRHTCFGGDH